MSKCNQVCMYNFPGDGCLKPKSAICPLSNIARDTNVLTNADHIRSMSDEELAKFLLEIMSNTVCFGEGMFPYHPCPQDQDCEKCGLGWLKQPYKGET